MRRYQSAIVRFTRVGPFSNLLFNLALLILSALCIIPFILVISISLSAEETIQTYGYRLIPKIVSFDGYAYLYRQREVMLRAFGMSVLVTGAGTVLGILLCSSMGYVLSRLEFKLRRFYTWLVFIPMIFSGGMVAGYFVMTQVLHLRNSPLALILPLCVSSFNIIICRTFFRTTIPDSVVESATMDGAGHWTIFFRIVLPLSLPVLATIGLFMSFGYWNDWFTSMLYIDKPELLTLSAYLNRILENISYITSNTQMAGITQAELLARLPRESARMAIVVISVLPIVCTYPFFQRYFVSGLTIGAVKG
ncbi:MAG: carbohydrate ABC transporter permease [Treponema sp.]|jgi:putative aldouronate transport system permease protein|nr:carbohydrate ABC transporter permease [Treponema sp.]